MKVFVPLNDDMLERLLQDTSGSELPVPYQAGLPTINQLRARQGTALQSSSRDSTSPAATPSSSALPALSSSTYMAGPSLG